MKVKGKGVGPEEGRKDTPASSVGEQMVVRQAVQLTVEVTQPRDAHGGGMSGDHDESAGKSPGTGKEISLREAEKMLLTRNEGELQRAMPLLGRTERRYRLEDHVRAGRNGGGAEGVEGLWWENDQGCISPSMSWEGEAFSVKAMTGAVVSRS